MVEPRKALPFLYLKRYFLVYANSSNIFKFGLIFNYQLLWISAIYLHLLAYHKNKYTQKISVPATKKKCHFPVRLPIRANLDQNGHWNECLLLFKTQHSPIHNIPFNINYLNRYFGIPYLILAFECLIYYLITR